MFYICNMIYSISHANDENFFIVLIDIKFSGDISIEIHRINKLLEFKWDTEIQIKEYIYHSFYS